MSEGDAACRVAVIDAGGVTAVVTMMFAPPNTREVLAAGCEVLRNLATSPVEGVQDRPEARKRVIEMGGLAAVNFALQMHPVDLAEHQEWALTLHPSVDVPTAEWSELNAQHRKFKSLAQKVTSMWSKPC